MDSGLLAEIQKGRGLKKAQTNDRSAPIVDGAKKTVTRAAAVVPSIPGRTPAGNSDAGGPGPPQLGGLFAGGMPTLKSRGGGPSTLGKPPLIGRKPSTQEDADDEKPAPASVPSRYTPARPPAAPPARSTPAPPPPPGRSTPAPPPPAPPVPVAPALPPARAAPAVPPTRFTPAPPPAPPSPAPPARSAPAAPPPPPPAAPSPARRVPVIPNRSETTDARTVPNRPVPTPASDEYNPPAQPPSLPARSVPPVPARGPGGSLKGKGPPPPPPRRPASTQVTPSVVARAVPPLPPARPVVEDSAIDYPKPSLPSRGPAPPPPTPSRGPIPPPPARIPSGAGGPPPPPLGPSPAMLRAQNTGQQQRTPSPTPPSALRMPPSPYGGQTPSRPPSRIPSPPLQTGNHKWPVRTELPEPHRFQLGRRVYASGRSMGSDFRYQDL